MLNFGFELGVQRGKQADAKQKNGAGKAGAIAGDQRIDLAGRPQ